MSRNNFGADGNILTKLLQTTCREAAVIMRVQLLEGPPQKFWGSKNVQISARFLTAFDFDREYLRNGSTHRTSEKKLDQPLPLPRCANKIRWTLVTNKKVLVAYIDQPTWTFFGRLHFGHYGVLRPEIFERARDWPKLPSVHPNWDGAPYPKKLMAKI